ncbi:hypothetical protein K2173_021976 [Erythroxylum novogranatense]|uniref:non-specific serine/threonine protein kinase n=1 Tax=Erythroxylum novogranatense TaxID=1862640 RepID=A0AAV8T3V0_9ROSI|nr:hypothetical protein K2173_021976 [Erythroxylum novogranatense]
MENSRVSYIFLFHLLVFPLLIPVSVGQLSPSETKILFQVRRLLEYPGVLRSWTNWTNFCYLPSSASLRIVCSNSHVTELIIVGNKASPSQVAKPSSGNFKVSGQTLSSQFSIDTFFTVLTKLSYLEVLSLVSLGLWGPLPAKVSRFHSLRVLNFSSNFIHGEIPQAIVSLKSLNSLVLADNLLNGTIPDLKELVLLEELNLGDNRFGPKFPSLSYTLVTVILNNNSLRSDISSGFKGFNQLQRLDVSSNKLVGPIPAALFSLPSIQYVDLADNQLTGAFPPTLSCTAKLEFVDISRNYLIGKLPSCIASNSSSRTVISSWNCLSEGNSTYQRAVSFCHKEALAVKPPVKSKEKKSSAKLGIILGAIGGVVGLIVVLGVLVLVIIKRSGITVSDDGGKCNASFADKISVRSASKPTDSRRVPQTMRSAAIGLPQYRVFSLEELEDATNNFDPLNFMEEESQGKVYKGWLGEGTAILVKCVKLKQKNLPQSLAQHMEVLSKLRHLHLVSVLGHCVVTYQNHPSTACTVFVVFEHISNGSLRDHLDDFRKKEVLKWPQRMAITIGVARGIQFLHTGVAPGIFGNNLRLENVLLDECLTAKLSNYTIPLPSKAGLESPVNGHAIDNPNSESAEKEDMYQLGGILLQVITGKFFTSPIELKELKAQLEKSLVEAPAKLREFIDPSARGSFAYQSLRNTVEITLNCLSSSPNDRPSIEDVLWNLQYSMQVQEGWTSSGNLATQM